MITANQFRKELDRFKRRLEDLEWAVAFSRGVQIVSYLAESAYYFGRMEVFWNQLDNDSIRLVNDEYFVEQRKYRELSNQILENIRDEKPKENPKKLSKYITGDKPGPRLTKLMNEGVVIFDPVDKEYVGIDPNGMEINLGIWGGEKQIEEYLKDHPTPSDW